MLVATNIPSTQFLVSNTNKKKPGILGEMGGNIQDEPEALIRARM